MTRGKMIEKILETQETLVALSIRREEVRKETENLRMKNTLLKDFIDQLVFK